MYTSLFTCFSFSQFLSTDQFFGLAWGLWRSKSESHWTSWIDEFAL